MVFNNNLLLGAAGQTTGFSIDQSARFNDGDSPELSRTYSISAPWTFSAWVKRGELGSENLILGASGGEIHFNSNDTLEAEGTTSSAVFRDPAAWYHIHVSDNGLYINGVSHGSVTTTSLTNTKLFDDFDGYVAEVHLQSGTSAYTNFGETNADTGQWVPKAATAGDTYLKFANSSNFGENSGTGGAWTASGLTAADQVTDSPTDNHCVLNPLWIDGYTLSDGNLVTSTSGDAAALGSVAFDPTDADGFYFEAKVTTAATFPNVGIRTVESVTQIGAVSNLSGNSTGRYSYTGSNGQFNDAGSSSAYGDAWSGTANKVIGVLVKAGSLYFSVDGTIQNGGTAAKTGLTGLMVPTVFYDAGSGTQAAWEMRFDASDWSTTPTGYKAISSNNFADPTIADPTAHFQTTLYTGTGSSQAVTQSGNSTFQPDLVWIKKRSGATEHALTDVVRGVTKELSSNDAGAEETVAQGLTAFGSAGFTVGTDGSYNTSSATYAGWQWKADNTSGSSNTDGSITSTVSANTTSGFSIVSYTGTGANATVGHGLGVAPQVLIVKNLIDADSWVVYHEELGATKGLTLDTTAAPTTASTFFNNTAPTSSVFSVGSGGRTNGSSDGMVVYCFTNVEGFSRFGGYTGNGSTDGPVVYTGFKPAFIILKRTNSAQEWQMYDNERDPYNVANHKLEPNSTSAESILTTDNNLDFLSNGFKLRQGNGGMNASGSTYIYMAFAESPFKTATAR